jgi:uncharacterized protein YyaL (SSP411 family)
MKDNKLIAEFMGLKDGAKYFSPTLEVAESVGLGMHIYPDEMRYHISWDWLMPVVEKIMWDNDIEDNECTNIEEALCDAKIDRVYEAVVEFIKTYNDGTTRTS